jgi:WhiB family transcriptional regulator, redox-sensing transcriptional regulator
MDGLMLNGLSFALWMKQGACKNSDPDIFYNEETYPQARAICRTCPVIEQCLEHAMDWPETDGIWGGTTPRQRRTIRQRRRRSLLSA